jgi:hypothetical protein
MQAVMMSEEPEGKMAYYQDIVVDYLRENRAVFVNTECCIQLNEGTNNNIGPHWYCDALAVDFGQKAVYLCEVTYAKGVAALLKRLSQWNTHWSGIQASLVRDCKVFPDWSVTPWLFMPDAFQVEALAKIRTFSPVRGVEGRMPVPQMSSLESIVPWNLTRHATVARPK